MNIYLNILFFFFTLLFYYYVLKPQMSLEVFSDQPSMKRYMTGLNMSYVGLLLLNVVVQFILNSMYISSLCGGSLKENIGQAGLMTMIPWLLIFGCLIAFLLAYPGLKSSFSDVIGFFFISSSANTLLTELLKNKTVDNNSSSLSPEEKQKMEITSDAILKIFGNTSILINQIVPENFEKYWSLMTPLFKSQYQNQADETTIMKKAELLKLVCSRDNIGEALWFVYTGVILISVIQLKITSRGCRTNPKTMEKNYQDFLNKEQEEKQKQTAMTSQTYTMTA